MSKILTLKEAVLLINHDDMIGIGGNVLHRAPMALVREIVRQNKNNLRVVKTAGAMDVDLLCFGNCVKSVDAGFISYESEFSLANHYRKAVQNGEVIGNEHACYTVISALRAASYGIPFMPVHGLKTGDLIEVNDYFTKIKDPFSEQDVTVVKALQPDVSIIHVDEADCFGNAVIRGPKFDDLSLIKASKKVIISAEKIVTHETFINNKQKVDIPHFLVHAVVHVENGAFPCSCFERYDINRDNILTFKHLKDKADLVTYLETLEKIDYMEGR